MAHMIRVTAEDCLRQDLEAISELAGRMLRNEITATQYDQRMLKLTARMRALVVDGRIHLGMGSD